LAPNCPRQKISNRPLVRNIVLGVVVVVVRVAAVAAAAVPVCIAAEAKDIDCSERKTDTRCRQDVVVTFM